MQPPQITLKNGLNIPILGLGTYHLTGEICYSAVKTALKSGYRHIDTASYYNNHKEIGKAIAGFKREDLFITSKVWYDDLHYDDVLRECDKALVELKTPSLDLYLVHWPNKNIPMKETMRAMKRLVELQKVKSVGVSNFTIRHLKDAMALSEIPVCVNQVEFHPHLYQRELLLFCEKHSINITAFAPLGRGEVFSTPEIKKIAAKYKKTPGQVTLKWLIQHKVIAIPKASTEEHLSENLNVFDFELTPEDMKIMDKITPQHRIVNPPIAEFGYI